MTKVDILYPSTQAMDVFKKQGAEHQLSYLCKICSKGFVSGRALGGHMRVHAPASIAPEILTETEVQKSKGSGAWDHKLMQKKEKDEEGLDGNGSNLMYDLRRNPKRSWRFEDQDYPFLLGHRFDSKPIDSSINCDLCGKEFSSWEGLFGHMSCHSETHQDSSDSHLEESQKHETQDQVGKVSESDCAIETEIDHPSGNSGRFDKWMKGKRSKRPRYEIQLINPHKQFALDTNSEEEDIAMCLVMLARGVNTATDPQAQVADEPVPGDLKLPNTGFQLPKCVRKKPKSKKIDGNAVLYDDDDEVKKARYRCTTCNKGFQSYQALGGHRTGHKNVKSSFSQIEDSSENLQEDITDEELIHGSDFELPGHFYKPHPKERSTKDSRVRARDETRTMEVAAFSRKKTRRIHECSICHRVFSSGQALGGHKRRHWSGPGASDTVSTISSNKDTPMQQQQMPARVELLDLNLPAPADDDSDAGNLNNLGGDAPDSNGISNAHSPPYLQPCLMGIFPKQGLFLYNSHINLSKDDEADSKTRKEIGFGRGCDSDFPMSTQPWLQLDIRQKLQDAEAAYNKDTNYKIRTIIDKLEEDAMQDQSDPEMADWEAYLPDPGHTRGRMSLYKQSLHVYWGMKRLLAKALEQVAVEMVELAQGMPIFKREMKNIQMTLLMQDRKMDQIIQLLKDTGIAVKTEDATRTVKTDAMHP